MWDVMAAVVGLLLVWYGKGRRQQRYCWRRGQEEEEEVRMIRSTCLPERDSANNK